MPPAGKLRFWIGYAADTRAVGRNRLFGFRRMDFTGSLTGLVGYRMSFFGHLASVEAGYKALRYKVDPEGSLATSVTLNGPFIGLSGQW